MLELMHREAPQIGFAHSLPQLLDRQRSFVLTNRQFLFARPANFTTRVPV